MLYFAYGSNLERDDFDRWCERHGHASGLLDDVVGPAALDDWALVFGRMSRSRGGGVLDLRPRPGFRTPGVVFDIEDEALAALDQKEGHPHAYERREVVVDMGGKDLECVTYIGDTSSLTHHVPSATYLDIVRYGYQRFGLDTAALEAAARAHEVGLVAAIDSLFVYGSLLVGERLHHYVSELGPLSIEPATIRGRLFDLGSYPGLMLDGGALVRGERVRFADISKALTILDEVEGFHGRNVRDNLYERRVVDLDGGPAWTYLYAGPDEGVPIPSGEWRRWRGQDGR
jgi:gamma-glutamylcyclotransferase (GGCT)/AIG2-like uncharacterized protein YtfP